ncbi:UpxY family transcription antiterminator [Granulicella sp. L60]|uniref:UpxY family transcription antiterminator n=1 Tax=Granulicella sp. L60 TaxID=1641866 RepID=UPI00131D70C7
MSCLAESLSNYASILNPAASDRPHWYAVYTYPRHEKVVTQQLESKSVEAFLPTFVTESRWKDRRVRIQTPVFPGYVFARIDLRERSKVFTIPGVIRMLSFNGTPAPIEDSEIEAVRLCVERGITLESCLSLEVGDRVRVRSGVLQGLEGLVSRCKNDRRLIVPISLINQSVAIEIDVRLLEPLSAQHDIQRRHLTQLGTQGRQ